MSTQLIDLLFQKRISLSPHPRRAQEPINRFTGQPVERGETNRCPLTGVDGIIGWRFPVSGHLLIQEKRDLNPKSLALEAPVLPLNYSPNRWKPQWQSHQLCHPGGGGRNIWAGRGPSHPQRRMRWPPHLYAAQGGWRDFRGKRSSALPQRVGKGNLLKLGLNQRPDG